MENKLVIYAPNDEFLTFMKFNAFLYSLRDRFTEIIPIIVPKAISVIGQATEFISISNNYLDEHGANYPTRLEMINQELIDQYKFCSDFRKLAFDYCMKRFDFTKYEFWDYYEGNIIDMKDGNVILPEYTVDSIGNSYHRDFRFIYKWLEDGNTLKPTERIFNQIKQKYGSLFNENTYVIITRNFKHKQPETNTQNIIINLEKFIETLTKNGIRIINIGFPPSHLNLTENYYEINESLTQEEVMSFMYLAKGAILCGLNGGYGVHLGTNCDVFKIARDWSTGFGISMTESRMKNKEVLTQDISEYIKFDFPGDTVGNDNFDKIVDILNSHKKVSKNLFSLEKKVVYIDE